MECAVETGDDDDHFVYGLRLCIFDIDYTSTLLKSLTVCAFGVPRGHALVDAKCVGMKWLHGAACLVAEVQRAFVGPLRLTGDATREAKIFSVLRDYLKTAQATIGGHI